MSIGITHSIADQRRLLELLGLLQDRSSLMYCAGERELLPVLVRAILVKLYGNGSPVFSVSADLERSYYDAAFRAFADVADGRTVLSERTMRQVLELAHLFIMVFEDPVRSRPPIDELALASTLFHGVPGYREPTNYLAYQLICTISSFTP